MNPIIKYKNSALRMHDYTVQGCDRKMVKVVKRWQTVDIAKTLWQQESIVMKMEAIMWWILDIEKYYDDIMEEEQDDCDELQIILI